MSTAYDTYLQSDAWKAVSFAVKKRAGFRCQVCNSQHDLQAHHRTYANRGNEMNHLDDLICLCRRCHGVFHGHIQLPQAPVTPQPPIQVQFNLPARKLTKREKRMAREMALGLQIKPNQATGHTVIAPEPQTPRKVREIPVYDHEGDMPKQFPFKMTKEFIRLIHTKRGGITGATVRALGVTKHDMVKGWLHGMAGREITREQAWAMLKGRELLC